MMYGWYLIQETKDKLTPNLHVYAAVAEHTTLCTLEGIIVAVVETDLKIGASRVVKKAIDPKEMPLFPWEVQIGWPSTGQE